MCRPVMLIALTLAAMNAMADAAVTKVTTQSSSIPRNLAPSSCLSPQAERAKQLPGYYLSSRELRQFLEDRNPSLLNQQGKSLDEVIVTSEQELLPMRDDARDIPGGLVSAFWAIENPTQAWRIFLPIPPE